MIRHVLLVATSVVAVAWSQSVPTDGAKDEKKQTVVKFRVNPMSAPRPVLKYELLPTVEEIETGSAMQIYLKCFMEQTYFYSNKEAIEEREKYQTMPLKDLPKELVNYGGKNLRYADRAARLSTIDFQVIEELKRDGINTLLPEIHKLIAVTLALRVRLRAEIAQNKFDAAVGTLKTLYKLGHQLGSHPTLIGNSVGLAIVAQATSCVEEMIQQAECPNLYYALVSLPTPLVSLRSGIQGERLLMVYYLGRLRRDGPESPANLEKFIVELEKRFETIKPPGKSGDFGRTRLNKRATNPAEVNKARKALVEYGLNPKAVEAMLPLQVVILDESRKFEEDRDLISSWLMQPYPQAERALLALEEKMLPTYLRVYRAQIRTEQRLRMLQVLEGLRLHAAANEGRLPRTLDEMAVPLPVDPVTDKPFRYTLEEGKAILRGTPPRGMEKEAAFNVIYEVTMSNPKKR